VVRFHNEDVKLFINNKRILKQWIESVIVNYGYKLSELNVVFCSDEYLREMNKSYLNHDFYTDIITFDNSDTPNIVMGDLFISIDRVKDNATQLAVPFLSECYRVVIHGVLHLLGHKDKSRQDGIVMRKAENEALALLSSTWNIAIK
jgi:probable rRNA maturation factor